jgi:hypothetical protein
MTWEAPASPWSTLASAVTGILSAKEQGKRDKAEADRQAELDKIAATTAALNNTKTVAETGKATAETQGLTDKGKRDALLAGDKATPLTMATPQPGKHFSKREQATQYWAQANNYLKQGASLKAKPFSDAAEKLEAEADKEDTAALAVKKQLDDDIRTAGQLKHWTAQEVQAKIAESDKLLAASRHDATTLAAAAMHIRGSLQVAGINRAGAMDRTLVTQGGDDRRAAAAQAAALHRVHITEDNTNRRFNVGEKHADAKVAKPPGFRGIDPTTAMLITKNLDAALAAGMDRTKVFAEAARLHGVSPVQIEGIYKDYSKTGQ